MDDTPEHTGLDSPDGTNQQGAAAGAAEEPTLAPQTPPFVCANPNHSSDCVRCVSTFTTRALRLSVRRPSSLRPLSNLSPPKPAGQLTPLSAYCLQVRSSA